MTVPSSGRSCRERSPSMARPSPKENDSIFPDASRRRLQQRPHRGRCRLHCLAVRLARTPTSAPTAAAASTPATTRSGRHTSGSWRPEVGPAVAREPKLPCRSPPRGFCSGLLAFSSHLPTHVGRIAESQRSPLHFRRRASRGRVARDAIETDTLSSATTLCVRLL
jgi:hypothetical protein